MSPKIEVDYQIELVPEAHPHAMTSYHMAPQDSEELRKQLRDVLEVRHIQPSKSSHGALFLFQKKHNASLHMCIDYRALNKLTVKNKYPTPLTADLFDQLGTTRWFTKLDLSLCYYHVRIGKEDVPKTTYVTHYGSYELLVMSFGSTNALTTFSTLMNNVLHPFLVRFVIVYLNDIVMYSRSLADHVDHLRQVFGVLRDNELYVNGKSNHLPKGKSHFLATLFLEDKCGWIWGKYSAFSSGNHQPG